MFLIIWVPLMTMVIAILLASVGTQITDSEYIRPAGYDYYFTRIVTIDDVMQPIFTVIGMSAFAIILVGLPEKRREK